MNLKNIDIARYNYNLPDEKIARYPLNERDQSNLLVYDKGDISKARFQELPEYLDEHARLIVNNTRVIRARLPFRKSTGAAIEIFCLEPADPRDYENNFAALGSCKWICTVGNLKKWKQGKLVRTFTLDGQVQEISAEALSRDGAEVYVQFRWSPANKSFGEVIEALGEMPIPPYLKRNAETIDRIRYQTVYSQVKGSVAAPTAGLHFTPGVFKRLLAKDIRRTEVTLHVGAGTFKPVQEKDARNHEMHAETFLLSVETLQDLLDESRKNVVVGTTSLRTLESIYWLGVKLLHKGSDADLSLGQWEVYDLPESIPRKEAIKALLDYLAASQLQHLEAVTQIMIVPGYTFCMTDELITNFHLPQSTLLLLIAAFIGEDWERVYNYALKHNFRFLSYGDSSLLKK